MSYNPYTDPVPVLVDRNGLPLRRDNLKREVSGPSVVGVRQIASGHPAQGLTPGRLAQLLRGAETGDATQYLELAEEMEEKYLHYLGVMGTRKRAVSQLPINVDAAGDDAESEADAQLIRDWLERDTLQLELFDILDAIGKGYSATEIVWETDELWLPSKLLWRDPRWFQFHQVDGNTLMLRGDGGVPEPLEPFKYITHVHPAKSGLPIRGGLARAAAWAYLFTNYSLKDWVSFLEVYGLPLRVGKYDPGEAEANIRLLEQAVGQIGSDAGAVIPKTMLIEFVRNEGSGASAELYEKLIKHLEAGISKAVVGQTNTTDAQPGGLGSGQANVHNEVREDIETADCVALSATLNRDLVRPMILLNRGPRKKFPRLRIGRADPVDVDAALKLIESAVKLGIEVSKQTFRKMTGLAEPEDGDDLIDAPTPAQPEMPAGASQEGVKPPTPRPQGRTAFLDLLKSPKRDNGREVSAAIDDADATADAIDRAIAEQLGDWEALVTPALEPIEQMIAGAASLEEVRDILASRAAHLIESMDVSAVTELLGRSGFSAAIAGRVEDPSA